MYVCIYVYMYIYIYVYNYIYICIYPYMQLCVYAYAASKLQKAHTQAKSFKSGFYCLAGHGHEELLL